MTRAMAAFAFLVILALGLLPLAARQAQADSWVRPVVSEVFSASRGHFVRVTPGNSWGDTVGFKGEAKGQYATAAWYARAVDGSYKPTATVTLPNPVAPVEFFVADGGRLVTLDNWHNRGYGVVVAVYAPDGKAVASYKLADLFTEKEIEAFSHSVSSIHWHEAAAYINPDQKTFYLMVKPGADLIVGLETGRYAYCETREGKYLCRDKNEGRIWGPHGEVAPQR